MDFEILKYTKTKHPSALDQLAELEAHKNGDGNY